MLILNKFFGWTFLFCTFLLRVAFAQNIVSDPLKDYVENPDMDRDIVIEVTYGKTSKIKDLVAPFQVIEMRADTDGDGREEFFFTVTGHWGRAYGNYWTPYIPVEGGYIKAHPKGGTYIPFRKNRFYVGNVKEIGKRGLLAYLGRKEGVLCVYELDGGVFLGKDIVVVNARTGEGLEIYREYLNKKNESKIKEMIKNYTEEDLEKKGYRWVWNEGKSLEIFKRKTPPKSESSSSKVASVADSSPSTTPEKTLPVIPVIVEKVVEKNPKKSIAWQWWLGGGLFLLGLGGVAYWKFARKG